MVLMALMALMALMGLDFLVTINILEPMCDACG
jgi:hypothetical protein